MKICAALLSAFLLAPCGNASGPQAASRANPAADSSRASSKTGDTGSDAARSQIRQRPSSEADAEMDRLLAILVQKKVLSKEEATSVRVEVKAESPDPPRSASSPPEPSTATALPREAAQAAGQSASATPGDEGLKVKPKLPFTISGYGQIQWTSLPGTGSTFQLRRGRIKIAGNVNRIASYALQVEAVNTPELLDAYLRFAPSSYAKLEFGQFKIPFSRESLTSSRDLTMVERSEVVNSLVPGRDNNSQGRDIGAKIGGSYNFSDSAGFDYAIGVFNGAGIDRKDDNNRKDLAVRLSLRPIRGLKVSGDYYNGASGPTELARYRQGAEIAYANRPLMLTGEFISGRDGAVHRQGWYGLAVWSFSKSWESVFRAEGFDPDRALASNTTKRYLGGINWYFWHHLKWQLNEGGQNQKNRFQNVFLTQLQFEF
jgi:phosphate-selective porin OprO/OprP